MATVIPTGEPLSLRIGNTWQWYRDLSDYPASAWTLTYSLRNAASKISFSASADGDRHLVSVAAATTAAYAAGIYSWIATVTDSTDRYEVGNGTITVAPNLALDAVYDDRSHAKTVLDAIESVLEGRASTDAQTITHGNRTPAKTPVAELLQLRSYYRREYEAELAAEKLAAGLQTNRVQARFR